MKVFESRLDEIFKVKELVFELPPGFGRYKVFFPGEAVAHPAKAYTDVLEYLVEKYTRPGDLVLDPMAGTYSTCVVAALHGRNCIGVDIEERFYKWGLEARKRVERHRTVAPKGRMIVLRGDARELSKLLKEYMEEITTIITSPPYGDSKKGKTDAKQMAEKWEKHRKASWNTWGASAHTLGRLRGFESLGSGYSDSKNNIGNLPYGDIDVILASPPHGETVNRNAGEKRVMLENIGLSTITARAYSLNDVNIGVLPYGAVDTLVTSPPYKATISTPNNSDGNLMGETYLEAMLKVYDQCYKVLRHGGKIIIIVKPFIRNKKVVDLPYHTYLMLEKTGFNVIEVLKYRLRRMSFWRILYYRKHLEVPRIMHEYIIIGLAQKYP